MDQVPFCATCKLHSVLIYDRENLWVGTGNSRDIKKYIKSEVTKKNSPLSNFLCSTQLVDTQRLRVEGTSRNQNNSTRGFARLLEASVIVMVPGDVVITFNIPASLQKHSR